MTQSPILMFRSDDFAIVPGEDQQTNPGVRGKAAIPSGTGRS